MKQLVTAIREQISSDSLKAHLEWFAGVRRDTGADGERAAANYIRAELEKQGIEVLMHEFDAWLSFPRSARLLIDGSHESFDCLTHAFTASTDSNGVAAEAVPYQVDAPGSESITGKIALVEGICTPLTVLRLSRAGAAGIVFINPDEVIHNMTATTVWGTPASDQLDRMPQLPAVSVRHSDGQRILAATAEGRLLRLHARVETGWYPSLLPEVRISASGPEAEDFILVGAHYCSWEYGITDNATGVACLLELARVLKAKENELRRSIRIAWWPGHSHGRYAGSGWYADQFFQELADHCVTYHNIDSPGVRGATQYVARHTTAEMENFCLQLIASASGQQAPVNRPSRAADQSFLANGIPAFSTYPFLPEGHTDWRAWTGGAANAWWWHTSEDTLDKADVAILALDTAISATGVLHLAVNERLPIDTVLAAQEIRTFADLLAEAAGHVLDVSSFTKVAAEYEQAVTEIQLQRDRSPGCVSLLNRLQLKLSRQVIPLVYSRGGRYANDPAELSPIMRNSRNTQFPGLADALLLDQLVDDPNRGFVLAGLRRQLNRAVDHLLTATRLAYEGLLEAQRGTPMS